MRGIVPDAVLEAIGKRYRDCVSEAVKAFKHHAGDEDALTGGLGQEMSRGDPIVVPVGGATYEVNMSYWKVPGRGARAPEKRYGTDGMFQFSVTHLETSQWFKKGVPFQAKKRWGTKDKDLEAQAVKMINEFGNGLVVDYRAEDYRVCTATDVVEFEGSSRSVALAKRFRPLAGVLSEDFLECWIGTIGLFYDPHAKEFKVDSGDLHIISTDVVAVRNAAMI